MMVIQEWEKYRRRCYGTGPMSAIQLRETRQAFLSGMFAMMTMMVDISAKNSEIAASGKLDELHAELVKELAHHSKASTPFS